MQRKAKFVIFLRICVAPLLVAFWSACAEAQHAKGDITPEGKPQLFTAIGKITAEAEKFEGKTVTVRGHYEGWQGDIEPPQVTRSDWVISDETGAIYVSGKPAGNLDPNKNAGTPVTVMGKVVVSDAGIPYIEAEDVKVDKPEKKKELPEKVGKAIPIGKILGEPTKFEGETVMVKGEYNRLPDGAQQSQEPTSIAAENWIVKDETGSIPVTGKGITKLDPRKNAGTWVVVVGTVKLSDGDAPYLEAHSVKTLQPKDEPMSPKTETSEQLPNPPKEGQPHE
ncbi:MAG: hypothetical protein HY801_05560 [Candidatus Lindowbacteria bacterium]|nr:hypothetical protein [Candidatus Lindowbacteria bacterium]